MDFGFLLIRLSEREISRTLSYYNGKGEGRQSLDAVSPLGFLQQNRSIRSEFQFQGMFLGKIARFFPKLRKFPNSNPPEEHSLKLEFFLRCYGGRAGRSQGLRLAGEEEVSHRDDLCYFFLV